MKKQFFEHLSKLARSDKRIFLLVGDIGYGAVEGFASEFPDRFLNVGVAEQNMATIAAGLAKKGFRPFIYSIANFPLLRAFEQVRNDIVHEGLPVTIVSIGTGFDYGNLGYSHHAIDDLAPALSLEELEVFSPANSSELEKSLNLILGHSFPSYLRLSKFNSSQNFEAHTSDDLQPYEVYPSESEVALLAYGNLLERAVEAGIVLARQLGTSPRVFSVPRMRIRESVNLNGVSKLFLLEEQTQSAGMLGVAFTSLFKNLELSQLVHLGIENSNRSGSGFANGTVAEIREIYGLSANRIAERIAAKLAEEEIT